MQPLTQTRYTEARAGFSDDLAHNSATGLGSNSCLAYDGDSLGTKFVQRIKAQVSNKLSKRQKKNRRKKRLQVQDTDLSPDTASCSSTISSSDACGHLQNALREASRFPPHSPEGYLCGHNLLQGLNITAGEKEYLSIKFVKLYFEG